MAQAISISQSEAKRALALGAHLRRLCETALCDGRFRRPIEMDQGDLLLAAASLRTLLFDDSGEPILLTFARQHQIDIRVEALETNLGLFLLSYYPPTQFTFRISLQTSS
jgi:hypothetical protein